MQAILTTLKRLTNLSRHLRPTRRPATPSACLRLEALEDRLVPSVTPAIARPPGGGPNPIGVSPLSPTGFAVAEESSTSALLSWNASSVATGYLVNVAVGNSWHQIANLDSSTTTFKFDILTAGFSYSFQVGAYNSFGTG